MSTEPASEQEPPAPPPEPVPSAIRTRAARIAQREANPLNRLKRAGADIVALLVLITVVTGSLTVFYQREAVHSVTGDLMIAAGFLVAVLVIAYLNPQVQQYSQMRSRSRREHHDRSRWHPAGGEDEH